MFIPFIQLKCDFHDEIVIVVKRFVNNNVLTFDMTKIEYLRV